jgi:TusA-related sulfurtransferase
MARARMADLAAGETLLVMATDPEAPIDLAAWAAEEGHDYEQRDLPGFTEFAIRKGGAAISAGE